MSSSIAHAGLVYMYLIHGTHALQQAMNLPKDLQMLLKTLMTNSPKYLSCPKAFAPNNTSLRTICTVCTHNLAQRLAGSKCRMSYAI